MLRAEPFVPWTDTGDTDGLHPAAPRRDARPEPLRTSRPLDRARGLDPILLDEERPRDPLADAVFADVAPRPAVGTIGEV